MILSSSSKLKINGKEISLGKLNGKIVYSKQPKYTELEYIESTGTQYIDTLYIPNDNTTIFFDFMPLALDTGFEVSGRSKRTTNEFTFWGNYSEGVWYSYGSGNSSTLTNYKFSTYTRYQVKMGRSVGLRFSTNNFLTQTTLRVSFSNYLTGVVSLGLFAGHDLSESTGWGGKTKTRFYRLTINEGNNTVHDFIPVLDSKNVPCIYDLITETYFYNQGTGSFNYEVS